MNCKAKIKSNYFPYSTGVGCARRAWKDGYCKQHHPEEKQKKYSARYEAKQKMWADAELREQKQAEIIESNLLVIGSALCPSCMQPISQNYLPCKNDIHKIYAERHFR